MVQIEDSTARVIIRVLDDITNTDARVSCSDAGFRKHFMTLATNPVTIDAMIALKQAMSKPPDG